MNGGMRTSLRHASMAALHKNGLNEHKTLMAKIVDAAASRVGDIRRNKLLLETQALAEQLPLGHS
ncbi:hypothetical protein [Thioclava sp.]|uniref:hypothetical protein n=1 Tax=Thioclava sp. TaxID=1933450 RepID=UPI003AA866CD